MKKIWQFRFLKSFIALLLCLSLVTILVSKVSVNAIICGTGTYDIEKTLDNRMLGYGVTFKQDKGYTGYTNKAGSESQQVSVLDVPSESGLMIVPFTNIVDNRWTFTTVRNSISIFEKNNPGYKVIAAINGGAFDINSNLDFNRQVTGPFCYDGNYYRTTTGSGMWSGSYGFKNDGSNNSLVSNSLNGKFTRTDYLVLAIFNENGEVEKELAIEKLNEEPDLNESSVYYGLYDKMHVYQEIDLPTVDGASTFLINGSMVLQNSATDFYGRGVVSENPGSKVLYNQFSIVTKNEEVKNALLAGKEVRVQFEATGAFKDVDYIFGGGQIVLKNGEVPSNINDAASDTHPRTAIGMKADGTYVMCVIDGRQSDKGMVGVGTDRLSAVMKYYGCVNAFNLDGGGSSTVVIRDGNSFKVMNSPSDGHERSDGDCLLIVVKEPTIDLDVIETTDKTVKVQVDIKDNANFDIEGLEVIVGSNKAMAENGVALVKGLQAKTEYDLTYAIHTSKGNTLYTFYSKKVYTNATEYKLRSLDYVEESDAFTFTLDYSDRGKVTNLAQATLIVNDKTYQLSGGSVTIPKAEIGEIIFKTKLIFESDSYFGMIEVEIDNLHSQATDALYKIDSALASIVSGIMGEE